MIIIEKLANENGGYSNMQSWDNLPIPETHTVWPDNLDDTNFYAYNGFVILTIEQVNDVDTVTSYVPNVEAWEAWKASLPDPQPVVVEPTAEEMLNALVGGMSYE